MMLSLLITPFILVILSFLVKDSNISLVSRLLSFILIVDITTWKLLPQEFYYLRSASLDIMMFSTVFILRDNLRALFVGLPCILSFILNIYEQFSYYQTIFYEYRPYLQFVFMQAIILGLVVNCEWRTTWKTNTQK